MRSLFISKKLPVAYSRFSCFSFLSCYDVIFNVVVKPQYFSVNYSNTCRCREMVKYLTTLCLVGQFYHRQTDKRDGVSITCSLSCTGRINLLVNAQASEALWERALASAYRSVVHSSTCTAGNVYCIADWRRQLYTTGPSGHARTHAH